MKYIDLHVHSNVSDGTFSPTQVVERAVENNLSAIALTDHDTINGISEAIYASKMYKGTTKEIEIIPGIELSAAYHNKDIHILGLFIDYTNSLLCDTLKNVSEERNNRNEKMAKNLSDAGIYVDLQEMKKTEKNAVLTRAHFAKYLFEHGYAKTMQEAYHQYLGADGPYYVTRKYLTPQEAIQLIINANGLPILAHPVLYHFNQKDLDLLISTLKADGLVGIEAIYSSNTNEEENKMRTLAHRHKLLITGGSDFHGANKPSLDIGKGKGNLKIPYSILEELKQYSSII